QPFHFEAADGVGDIRRLIELQAYIHVFGHHLLEVGDGGFDAFDYAQGGGVGACGDRDVDRTFSVDVGVCGDDVGAVLYRADVAQVNGGSGDRTDGRVEQFREVAAEGRAGARDTFHLSGEHVAGRHDE